MTAASSTYSEDEPCDVVITDADDSVTINGSSLCERVDICTVAVPCKD